MSRLPLLALLIPAAAAAQPPHVGGIAYEPHRGPSFGRQVDRIDDRIDRARDRGQISRRDARGLEREARQIDRLRHRYAHGGLSEAERRELQARIHYLSDALAVKRSRGAAVRKGRGS